MVESYGNAWTDHLGVVRSVPQSRKLRWIIPAHAALRAFVFVRDRFTCRRCGVAPLDVPLEYDGRSGFLVDAGNFLVVDHVLSREMGGSNHPDNLQTLCRDCNSTKLNRVDLPALRAAQPAQAESMTHIRDSYGVLVSAFWDGATGQQLQAMGAKDAIILAAFLCANPYANMIGLYDLTLGRIRRHLPVLKGAAKIERTLGILTGVQYAFYDERTEFVWVKEMARIRLNLRGEPLKPDDNRRLGALKLYKNLPINPFLGPFFDRYARELALSDRRDYACAPQGARQGASERTPSPLPPDLRPHQYVQVPEIRDQVPGTRDQVPEKAAAPPQLTPTNDTHDASRNLNIITALAHKELIPLGLIGGELIEALKEQCAQRGIGYDSQTVRKAADSALFRAGRLSMVKARP